MSKDNVIDFGSFRKRPAPIGKGIENENRAELEAMMGTIPANMQDFVGRRFTFLMMFTVVTARVAEMLKELDYDPSDFDPEEESTEAFLANGPFFTEDEDRAPLWNGPMYDAVDDEIFYRVASSITLPAASAPRLEPTNSQPFFPLSQQPPFMAYLLLMHFCPFSPIPLFKLPYLGATEQLHLLLYTERGSPSGAGIGYNSVRPEKWKCI